MMAAGFGLRREVDTAEIVALFRRALEESGVTGEEITCFATLQDRASVPAFRAAALHFRIDTRPVGRRDIAQVKHRVVTQSERIEKLYGVGSVAEAVALVAAGEASRLILPRIASGAATCAIAGVAA